MVVISRHSSIHCFHTHGPNPSLVRAHLHNCRRSRDLWANPHITHRVRVCVANCEPEQRFYYQIAQQHSPKRRAAQFAYANSRISQGFCGSLELADFVCPMFAPTMARIPFNVRLNLYFAEMQSPNLKHLSYITHKRHNIRTVSA